MTSAGPARRQPSRRRQQADSTHRQLLDAARDVFEERGYRATTIRAITSRASTAQGTFYLHFENKEDAFGQVLREVWKELYSMVDWEWDRDDPRQTTRSAVKSVLQVVASHPGLSRAVLEGALDNETVERNWLANRMVLIERIAELIEREQAAGRARDFDPLLTAHALGSMAEWVALSCFAFPPGEKGRPDLDKTVDVVTEVWYRALYDGAAGDPAT